MRIVFLGTPEFTLPLLEACGDGLVGVVAQPDRPVGRSGAPQPPASKKWALGRGLPVLQPERVKEGRLAAALRQLAPDVAVVAAYGRILPADALAVPRLGCINVHASLLPALRGAAPAQWAIAHGLRETGVTIMQMDEGLDTGDILLQRALPIADDDTGETLLPRLGALGALALGDALPHLESLPRRKQDHAVASWAPILTREDGRIEFSRPAAELDHRRRGFTPWPGAFTTLRGAALKVHAALPLREPGPDGAAPGEIVAAGPDGIDVACGGGTIWRLLEVQPENRKRMPATAFLAGHPLKPGDRLGT